MRSQDALSWFGGVAALATLPALGSGGFDPWEAATAASMSFAAVSLFGWANRSRMPNPFHRDNLGEVRPATIADAEAIHSLAVESFGTGVTDKALITSLIRKSRKMFWVLVDKNHQGTVSAIVGYVCLIPLSQVQCNEMEQGNFGLNSLHPSNVPRGNSNISAIYIGAIVGAQRWARARVLGFAEDKARELGARSKSRTVFAKAVTPDGLRLVKQRGFEPIFRAADGLNCFFRKRLA